MRGFFNQHGQYYEADQPMNAQDYEVPIRPSERHILSPDNTWVPDRRQMMNSSRMYQDRERDRERVERHDRRETDRHERMPIEDMHQYQPTYHPRSSGPLDPNMVSGYPPYSLSPQQLANLHADNSQEKKLMLMLVGFISKNWFLLITGLISIISYTWFAANTFADMRTQMDQLKSQLDSQNKTMVELRSDLKEIRDKADVRMYNMEQRSQELQSFFQQYVATANKK